MIIGEHHKKSVMLSAVVSVDYSHDRKRATVTTVDGDTATYDSTELDGALRSTIQASFPADGAKWLQPIYNDQMKIVDVELRSILGFIIDATGELRAVTTDGNMPDPTLLFPDGRVERFEESWPNLDAYRAYLIGENFHQ